MKRLLGVFLVLFLMALSGFLGWGLGKKGKQTFPTLPKERPLDVYTIENLGKYKPASSTIKLEKVLKDNKDFSSYLFSFSFNSNPASTEKKRVTGLINIPKNKGLFPAVVMFRGYVDQKIYKTGDGTRRAGEYFAKNGFITIAPDFLGYGESDQEAGNIFEARFQTYTTVLTLLNSLNSLDNWDKTNTFLWGHSNGGQIALTVLEITGAKYPATLWAPVSKPFPYSILYYTDESDDRGKLIRRELAIFEELYDPDLYSFDNYYQKITAPLQLHQGTADDAVPKEWSDNLAKTLLDLDLPAQAGLDYFVYPGADHNLNSAWDMVVVKDLAFFGKHQK